MKTKLILAAFAALLLSSCCAQRIAGTTIQSDSVHIEVRERVVKQIDTVVFEMPLISERIVTRDTSSLLENRYALSEAAVDDRGNLYHSLLTKPVREAIPHETSAVVRDSIVYRDRDVEKTVEVPRQLTKWQRTQQQGFWALLALVVGFGAVKLAPIIRRFV